MSYTIHLEVDVGGPDPVCIEDDYLNYTYNCGPMFRLALGGDGLYDLDGVEAGVAAQRLGHAIGQMAYPGNREKYEALNPPNGWGDHQGATKFLERVRAECLRAPKAIVRVC